ELRPCVYVTVSVKEAENDAVPSPESRSAAGTKNVGSAADVVCTAVVRLPLAEPACGASVYDEPAARASDAPVIASEPLHVVGSGSVKYTRTMLSLPRASCPYDGSPWLTAKSANTGCNVPVAPVVQAGSELPAAHADPANAATTPSNAPHGSPSSRSRFISAPLSPLLRRTQDRT